MTGRHLAWIAGAIAALLAVWGLGRLLRSGSDATAGGFTLPGIAADSADTIVVAAPAETIVLARADGGRWSANGLPGSAEAVAELAAALRDSTPAELVAQSAASFGRLGVDSAAARRVRVVHGSRVLLDVFVSERGPDAQSAYVRAPGDSAVYSQPGQLGTMARRGLDDWREKTIAVVNPDSVGAVELVRGTRRAVLTRKDSTWRLAGAATDSGAVARLLERYRVVTAAGFPSAAQLDSAFRGRAERRAVLRGRTGAELLTLEFDSTAGGYWARQPGAERHSVFRMNTWDVEDLVPADSTLSHSRRVGP